MAKKNSKSQAEKNENEYSDSLDGGMPMDEPGASHGGSHGARGPRGPVLVWSEQKDRALAFVSRNPENEDGETIDEITKRLAADDAFSADVESGALTPAKVQLRRQQLVKRGLQAPELRRRSYTRYTPPIEELNTL